ncbi:MAG TPA: 3-hydroxyacyl-CoA dehydrogenase family protein [bacterium]|nr:3-hydroxyacyl-CoA dehydrogenase family protein [bacterium]
MAEKIAVLGAGTMGHGIAQIAAQAGFQTVLCDVDAAALSKGFAKVRENLESGVAKGKVTAQDRDAALERLKASSDLVAAADGVALIVEAIPERMDLKESVFRMLGEIAPPDAILATNTSSLPVSKIAASAKNPQRVIGMHFFNPPHIVKLCEIVRAQQTSEHTLARAKDMALAMGREIIVVVDSPGFATSRLGLVIGLEAMRMLEAGVASAEDIDRAMELGYRHPMGPLRLTDLVGLDVRLAIAEHLYKEIGEQFRPPDILRKMVAEGKLGKKTGQGFYKWE